MFRHNLHSPECALQLHCALHWTRSSCRVDGITEAMGHRQENAADPREAAMLKRTEENASLLRPCWTIHRLVLAFDMECHLSSVANESRRCPFKALSRCLRDDQMPSEFWHREHAGCNLPSKLTCALRLDTFMYSRIPSPVLSESLGKCGAEM